MSSWDFGGFDFGDLWSVISGLLSSIIAALEQLWNDLVLIAQTLASWIVSVAKSLVQLLGSLVGLLKHLLGWLYTTIIKPIIDELEKIEGFLKKILTPVLNILLRIRKWFNQYIAPWIKLATEIISRIRQFLALLKLFHVAWAQKLDQDFQTIQNYINEFLLLPLQTLNSLISWVQLMSDPTQILRKAFWQNTAFSGMSEIYGAANISKMQPLSPSQQTFSSANQGTMNVTTPPIAPAAGAPAAIPPPATAANPVQISQSPNYPVTLSPDMAGIAAGLMSYEVLYNPAWPGYTGPQNDPGVTS